MSIGDTERATQDRVVSFFKDRDILDYEYVGNLKDAANKNIREDRLRAYLRLSGYSQKLIDGAVSELVKAADDMTHGLYDANHKVYSLLKYGAKVKETADGAPKTVYFMDVETPTNNDFAIAEEVTVVGRQEKRPDLVIYVNGIAMAVIELKKSSVSVSNGIRQNLTNQKDGFIAPFFTTMQFCMAGNEIEGLRYGTIQTKEKYYMEWKPDGFHENEDERDPEDARIMAYCEKLDTLLLQQIYQMFDKKRFIDLIENFVVYDKGIKKVCRYNQFYGIKRTQRRLAKQRGGIIWHTQGSGKTLTMVWLSKWILANCEEENPRVLIVTDRDELDEQIEKTYIGVDEKITRTKSCDDLLQKLNSYEKYWNRIEECTKYDVSSFVRDYLSVKQLVIPSQKKIYISFKEYVELSLLGVEELLKDLLAYAKRYEILLNGNTKNKALDSCINRLNRLETTVTRPFFLEVLRLNNEGKLDISQVTDIFLITENYLFRRTICDLPTNALNKIFLKLHREIIRYDGTDANYVEKFKYALLSKKEKARFPDDDEFATQFTERQVYQMNSKNKIYILERLENYGTAEDKDVYSHCDDGTYSIEHIMPQHLTPAWVKALGDDYEQIHETWLHRIANLTLTAYNSKYSNSSFAEKKIMKNGFEDSGIRMNTYIAKKEKWTLTELEERNQYLMGRALEIWLTPSTEFKPEEKQLDSYTLDDDANLSGRLIARFSYKNTEQPATSWVEMFQKVLQILYAADKNVITKLAASKEDNIALHFSMNETDFTKSAEIGDGIYVWTNTSTQSKLSVLSRVFKLYDADPTDLVFYLRDENEGVEDEVGTRYELRRKYWTYALDYIKKTHGEGGSFSNVNPSKENWINGFFGISGFSLCCVANYDSARVELYFGKAKKEDNKKAFDAVILHKDAIENSLGVKLIWNRGDDIKSSKISYQINNVSIENETDWLQMAKFHAHWSKKFYDVIVPYLR